MAVDGQQYGSNLNRLESHESVWLESSEAHGSKHYHLTAAADQCPTRSRALWASKLVGAVCIM